MARDAGHQAGARREPRHDLPKDAVWAMMIVIHTDLYITAARGCTCTRTISMNMTGQCAVSWVSLVTIHQVRQV